MAIDNSQLSYPQSSPPPELINPKKRKTTLAEDDNDNEDFTYPGSDDDDEGTQEAETQEGGASASISGEDSQSLPPPIPVDGPEVPANRPIFNLPLTGGLFSKKLTASTTSSFLVKASSVGKSIPDNSPFIPLTREFRPEVTPPPRPPSPGPSDANPFNSYFGSSPNPSPGVQTYLLSTPRPANSKKTAEACGYVSIVTSSGETFRTKQNPVKSISARDDYYMSNVSILGDKPSEEPGSIRKSYYGIDIHSLLDEYKAEQDLAAARRREEKSDTPGNQSTSNLKRGDSKTTSKSPQKTPMWTEKYRAKRFADLVGDERTHRQVLRWFKSWDKTVFPSNRPAKNPEGDEEREMKKILLIHGPPGLGKTTLAHVAAKQAGYDVVEVNASDDRSAAVVKGRIKDILSNEGVKGMSMLTAGGKQKQTKVAVGKPVCLVIDEIDGVAGGTGAGANEGGFIKALIDLVVADQKLNNLAEGVTRKKGRRKGDNFKLQRPIVAVCNDLYVPALKALRPLAEVVHMRKPPTGPMVVRLKSILEHEGFRTEDGAVRRLVELSCMGGNSTGKAAGDMRAAVIGCEWIACRLRSAAMKFTDDPKARKEQKVLTRKIVEQEFGAGGLGEGDGKGGGGGRGNVREVVERVFCAERETKRAGSKDTRKKKSSGEKLREIVEGLGEFEKIIMDCFTTYPTRPFNDDPFLTKPNAAYEWLYFSDLLSTRVFQEQEYELAGYLSHPILAFHHIFCSPRQDLNAGRYKPSEEETDAPPFTGPAVEWEVREGVKATKALIQSVHSCLTGIRLHQCFKSAESVAMELAPWVSRILSPSIKPVVVGGSGPTGSIASVRREGEKRLVDRGVEVMCCMGIEFEKIRVEGFTATGSGWIYRMEPYAGPISIILPNGTDSRPTARSILSPSTAPLSPLQPNPPLCQSVMLSAKSSIRNTRKSSCGAANYPDKRAWAPPITFHNS